MIQCIMAQVVPLMTNGLVSAKLITATITAGDLNIIPHTHKDLFCKSYFTEIVKAQTLKCLYIFTSLPPSFLHHM